MMIEVVDAKDAIAQILESGLAAADDSAAVVPTMALGQHSDQGDVIFWRLPELPEGVAPAEPELQLAPGTSRGSRHCISQDDAANVKFWRLPDPSPLRGPVLQFLADVTIAHPEHGNQVFPQGIYLVSYQRRYAEDLRRVQD